MLGSCELRSNFPTHSGIVASRAHLGATPRNFTSSVERTKLGPNSGGFDEDRLMLLLAIGLHVPVDMFEEMWNALN